MMHLSMSFSKLNHFKIQTWKICQYLSALSVSELKQYCAGGTTQQCRLLRHLTTTAQSKQSEINLNIPDEDKKKILHNLNTLTNEEMRVRQHIPFSFCDHICKYREAKGTIFSIEELMNIKGVGEFRLKQICEKLLAEPDLSEKKHRHSVESSQSMKIENHFHPELNLQDLKSLTNVTSVEVCLDSVHFATMTRDLELTQWGHFVFPSSNLYKNPPTEIFLQALEMVDKLPVSNIYLFESRMYKQASNSSIQFRLFIGQMQMALQTLINKDIKTSRQHRVFYASNTFVSKIFDLIVGGERISGQHIVKQIEDMQYTEQVHIPSDLWRRYKELELPLSQERYCKCFLLSLAFCQSFLLPLIREEN